MFNNKGGKVLRRDELIENWLTYIPLFAKRISKGLAGCETTKHQIGFLHMLKYDSGKPMNYYGARMMISKPNLTVLADKLIEDGLVERDYLPEDRRVIILKITKDGENFLEEQISKLKQHLLQKLSVLSDEDIERLYQLMEESRIIFSKIEDNE